jgi:hypothetical protein
VEEVGVVELLMVDMVQEVVEQVVIVLHFLVDLLYHYQQEQLIQLQ